MTLFPVFRARLARARVSPRLLRAKPLCAIYLAAVLLALAGCATPPAPPVAVAAVLPTSAPSAVPSIVPTAIPTPTAVPSVAPTAIPTAAPPTSVPAPTAVPLPRYDLVLVGATLIDATGAPPLHNAAVAIQGRYIMRVGTADTLPYSPDTPVLDVRGATMMPGFINTHVHISGLSDDDLRGWTRAGVTTLRDLAGRLDTLTATRDRLAASDDPTLPRLLVAGPIVTVTGGYPFAVREQTLRVEGVAVRDAADARAIVTTLADHGADAIKLAVSGRTDVHWNELTVEDQLPDFRQRRGAPLHRRRVRAAGPVRLLVDLDPFLIRSTEHHRAEPAVADGERVLPLLRRMRVPEVRRGIQ